jgi:hypothetical protein
VGVFLAVIGRFLCWRHSFVYAVLTRVARIQSGRLQEWASRDGRRVRYENPLVQRTLTLDITRTQGAGDFDAAIWQR